MLFNTLDFLLFATIFFGLWPLLKHYRQSSWIFLTSASFIFYGWWSWHFILLIVANGLIDYIAALCISSCPAKKKVFLYISLLGNLGSLCVFKYLNFGIENINEVISWFGSTQAVPYSSLALPVGISFYTFQSMSYTIDVYKGELKPTKNIFHFFAYLSMFPQLVAGPIVRAKVLLPQLEHKHRVSSKGKWDALYLIVIGYFKKVAIADNLADSVNNAMSFSHLENSAPYWWLVMIMFSIQIYCDFSGYSDIARGLAKWMGYDFPLNFNHPYFSRSIKEFWSRWHISLSTWFRDYVYLPLGGSRVHVVRMHVNLWVTLLLSGLWHGASWNFLIWGAIHSFFLSLEKACKAPRWALHTWWGKALSHVFLLVVVIYAWVFFRAEGFSTACNIVVSMSADWSNWEPVFTLVTTSYKASLTLGVLVLYELICFTKVREIPFIQRYEKFWMPILLSGCLVFTILFRGLGGDFIYFQF